MEACRWNPVEVYALGAMNLIGVNKNAAMAIPDFVIAVLRTKRWIRVDEEHHGIAITRLGQREYDAFMKWTGWNGPPPEQEQHCPVCHH